MKTGLVYDDIYLRHNWKNHPENMDRLISIVQGLDRNRILKHVERIKPRRAKVEEVAFNHDPTYIQEVHDFCSAGGGYLDPDTYAVAESYEVALYAVGGVLEGIDALLSGELETVFCAIRPPGHHAEYSKAMGFCLFNNVAVGAWYLLNKGFKRVFIIDFDAHHGNGTQKSFYEEDRVFYFSTHEYPFYPGTGSDKERGAGKGLGYTYNVPLNAGAGDEEYESIYGSLLPKLMKEYEPQFVLISAGYDIHKDDPLTYLNVSTQGVRNIVKSILITCSELNVPSLFALEGGYNLKALAECVSATMEIMLEV
ncbi:histone deacetylase superfamily [Hydrogenobacter thermophilus TK-6]|uniref:Acetoin utilization protein n=1 Tax=Hydrogenobacter thermophilus (strain DSM 6534 / IAM 12695 / TK-6) TaxID=608538 RepID=D3DJ37_HYDTT|nr:histone deacetylase [Hydrogenobacter thermophilus]ADO45763.1 histone deacetylase superfamily [Hydrogenobacter thermophilus TK-6]BAI69839.1 acetoin utilization protein [Hydrogenobacter thermophilus TK-6]